MYTTTRLTELLDIHANRIMMGATALMLAFFLSFIAVLAQAVNAHAETDSPAVFDQTCGGTDLISQYREYDPEKLKALKLEADHTPNGKSIFWKIEKPGIAPSYLLGTMHMADERISRLVGKRLEAFEIVDTVIVENVEALDPQSAAAAMMQLKELTFYTDGTTLEQRLEPDTIEKLKIAAAERGMPYPVANMMQPWLIAASVALPACEMEAKRGGKPVLDALIAEKAKTAGKTLIGLETVEEQFSAMANLPETFHLEALRETLNMGDLAKDVMETMKLLYMHGSIGMIMPLTKAVSPATSSSRDYEGFQNSLITNRNAVMAKRSLAFLEKGNALIAVGALHLPGDEGLVEKFRMAGFTVTSME
jgi:uncharacterized protein YbaP (TraB family)